MPGEGLADRGTVLREIVTDLCKNFSLSLSVSATLPRSVYAKGGEDGEND